MKNIWWFIGLIAVVFGAWYFNQNYLNKVSSTKPTEDSASTDNSGNISPAKDVLVYTASNGVTKTVDMSGKIETLAKLASNWPDPAFSPDKLSKATVEFSNAERNFGYSLYISDSSGANKKKITQNDEEISLPRWSKDSKTIYYLQAKGEQTKIMRVVVPVGEPQEILSESGIVSDLFISSDNASIVYLLRPDTQNSSIGDIIVASVDAKTKKSLTKAIKILGWLT